MSLQTLSDQITRCELCPRLRGHCRDIARKRKRKFANYEYWGQPVPGFGDPEAQLLIVGLAPGAHGSNRTGRVFTGDASGDWLFAALHEHAWANRATSRSRDDGLTLTDCYITAAARCRRRMTGLRPWSWTGAGVPGGGVGVFEIGAWCWLWANWMGALAACGDLFLSPQPTEYQHRAVDPADVV